MGTRAEKHAVSSKQIVCVLEQYCDLIYKCYQALADGKITVAAKILSDDCLNYETMMSEEIQNIEEKKRIVFLICKSEYWKFVHSLWQETQSDISVETTVIPVPYYYRGFELEVEEEQRIDCNGYPEEVKLTNYSSYNFEEMHPDVIVYQFPYDQYSYALSVHPFFYISNLRKYAEKMVFIPPYVLREAYDEKTKYGLCWLLQTPGVIYADMIFVQSEHMKKMYKEVLENFTSESGDINWNSKIKAVGSAYWDWEMAQRKRRKKLKKSMIYYVSGSVLFEYKEKMLKKIQQFIALAKKYQDTMEFLWYPDFHVENFIKKNIPDVWEEYCGLMKLFQKEVGRIVGREEDIDRVVDHSDAIYGDGGVLMTKCRQEHKLVLHENPEILIGQPKEYEKKNWSEDIMIAVEGEWSLENIICETINFEYRVPMEDCGKRMWEVIN